MLFPLLKKDIIMHRWYYIIAFAVLGFVALIIPWTYRTMFPLLIASQSSFEFANFVWQAWWGQTLYQLGFLYAIILGANLLSQDGETNIMEFLLTRGVLRRRVFISKLLADIIGMAAIVLSTTFILFIVVSISHIQFSKYYSMVGGSFFVSLGLLVPYSLAVFFTVIFRNRIIGCLCALLWVGLDIFIYYSINDQISLTYYVTDMQLYQNGSFPWLAAIRFLLISVVFFGLALRTFINRDV